MNYSVFHPLMLAVLFTHPGGNYLTPNLAQKGRALGLKYAIAYRLHNQTTVRVKLVAKEGRPMVLDYPQAGSEGDALACGIRRAIVDAEQICKPTFTSVQDALAS